MHSQNGTSRVRSSLRLNESNPKTILCFAALLILFALSSCGGGGGSSSSDAGSAGVSRGTITGFGSVIVNGIRFNTGGAEILFDDNPGPESDLRVGMVVTVTGRFSGDDRTGTADRITRDELLKGPVDEILPPDTIKVLNQTVHVGTALFEDFDTPGDPIPGDLMMGTLVEVDGHFDASGDIQATRIEKKISLLQFKIKGIIRSTGSDGSFVVGAQTIDFATAERKNFPAQGLSPGLFVEVKGDRASPTSVFIASVVEVENQGLEGFPGDRVEVEGFVNLISLPFDTDPGNIDFEVSGQPVDIVPGTIVEGGSLADIDLNDKVEVEGILEDRQGELVLVAGEIDLRRANNIKIAAFVEKTDGVSVTLLGIRVLKDDLTELKDSRDDLRPFTLGDIEEGDYLEVRGTLDGTDVIASRIERDDPDDIILQGFVTSETPTTMLEILGVKVHTSGAQFENENDGPISAEDFFDRIGVGSLVKAKGSIRPGTENEIDAREVEIEE
ncbi:MAG: hypothetical protein GTN70_05885 [Deltaproteobacteria bacterium]|nr:hypothetical protein [Deltaproteobacteria bacterium]NIS77209.1 hypothetical protein [Deltaproteobacteria bacterium]